MIARAAPSWQLLLADLSLILFVATAAALAHAEEVALEAQPGPLASGSPVAVLRGAGDARDLAAMAQWLADYRPDPREQLTLTISYTKGTFPAALTRAEALRLVAQAEGQTPRIVLEPAGAPALHASFAFDQTPDMARKLQP